MADIRFINPETLAKPPSYTHVVEVVGACRTVHISGQLGIDRDGNIVGDFRAQAVQVFENLKDALAAVGAKGRAAADWTQPGARRRWDHVRRCARGLGPAGDLAAAVPGGARPGLRGR